MPDGAVWRYSDQQHRCWPADQEETESHPACPLLKLQEAPHQDLVVKPWLRLSTATDKRGEGESTPTRDADGDAAASEAREQWLSPSFSLVPVIRPTC